MAKKRALVDATLLVASLSDVFTQDIEDMDFGRARLTNEQSKGFTQTPLELSQKDKQRDCLQ